LLFIMYILLGKYINLNTCMNFASHSNKKIQERYCFADASIRYSYRRVTII
jgi:hypothetical protein